MCRPLRLPLCLLALLLPWVAFAQSAKPGPKPGEEPKVVGMELSRAGGGYLGFNIEGMAFVLRFYDEDKQEVAPDAIRALVRWDNPQKAGKQRAVMAAAGNLLRSPPVARPPYSYVAYMTLIGKDNEVLETVTANTGSLPDTP